MECWKHLSAGLAVFTGLLSGCAMCSNPFDECYSAFGGSRPRADMLAGRVGSKFVEAGVWSEAPAQIVDVEPLPASNETSVYDNYLDAESFESDPTPVEAAQPNSVEEVIDAGEPESLLPSIEADAPESAFDPVSLQ